MKSLYIFTLLISLSISQYVLGQTDSLVFKTGTYMIGEAKSMDRNVLTFKTTYSDSDFRIEWDGIAEIYTDTYFLITLTDGSRYNGTLKSVGPGKISIISDEGEEIITPHNDVVWLDDKDKGLSGGAAYGLRVLTRNHNFGADAAKWREWWKKQKKK